MKATETRGAMAKRTAASSLLGQAWVNIVLAALAAVIIGLGFYVKSKPAWTVRSDIEAYNQGVAVYREPLIPEVSIRTEGARPHFETALMISRDSRLKALALSNLGTIDGRLAHEALTEFQQVYRAQDAAPEGDPALTLIQQEVRKAIDKLAEAVRIDPSNEDAKYNLEFLDRERGAAAALGPKYSPGEIDKGY